MPAAFLACASWIQSTNSPSMFDWRKTMSSPKRLAVARQSFSTSASVARPYFSGSRVPSRFRFGSVEDVDGLGHGIPARSRANEMRRKTVALYRWPGGRGSPQACSGMARFQAARVVSAAAQSTTSLIAVNLCRPAARASLKMSTCRSALVPCAENAVEVRDLGLAAERWRRPRR